MSNSETPPLLFLLPVIAVAVGVSCLIWWRSYSHSVLRLWASAKRFELLHFKPCFLHGGFSWWTTSYKQMVFFVRIRDDSGRERAGWVKFGRFFWGGEYSSLEPKVIWSQDEAVAPAEYAQRIVDGHTRGLVGGTEVWHQMIDHATPDTLEIFVSRFTPELHAYFRHVVLAHTEAGTEQERALLQSLRDWYEKSAA